MVKKGLLAIFLFILGVMVLMVYAQDNSKNVSKEYRISPGDILEIVVFGEPDLSTNVRVAQDGTINYPLLGNIMATGLTVRELESNIAELLGEDYLVTPQASVFVKEFSKITIMGAVKMSGSYEMKEQIMLTKAISMAGGFSETADSTKIKIVSRYRDKDETVEVNFDQIVKGEAPDIELKNNDSILVEELGRFSIMGQVIRPGGYTLKKGLTALEAISLAGGFSPTASKNGTRVIRGEGDKKKTIIVPLGDIMRSGNSSRDVVLQPGDTIVVPESFF